MKKFKLTNIVLKQKFRTTPEDKWKEVTLHKIQALISFSDVKKGDFGGWIEKEDNLSHEGDCWIYDDAFCFDNGLVKDNAVARNHSWIYGDAVVQNAAQILDRAEIFGYATIKNYAICKEDVFVYGHSSISGHAIVSTFEIDDHIITSDVITNFNRDWWDIRFKREVKK